MALASLGVCLALAAVPHLPPRFVQVSEFTLAWTHSIEKVRWEEDYRVIPGAAPDAAPQLRAGKARIKGSAAGMEPPPDAVLRDGWYVYQPPRSVPGPLRLTRSSYVPDYDWCVSGVCHPLSRLLPSDGNITLLYPCQEPRAGVTP